MVVSAVPLNCAASPDRGRPVAPDAARPCRGSARDAALPAFCGRWHGALCTLETPRRWPPNPPAPFPQCWGEGELDGGVSALPVVYFVGLREPYQRWRVARCPLRGVRRATPTSSVSSLPPV